MYEVFYNLKAEPFRLSPDHKFRFEHKGYAKARAYMVYAFRRAEGFVMITGRPGTGKTTLIGELVESLPRDEIFTANLVCTQLRADDLLKTVGYSFGVGSARIDKAELLHRLTVLFQQWHRGGRRALLIVDEAQDLTFSAMEELRLLTNIQIGGQPLLQIFLVGQPQLRDLILSPEMEQVHQRIVAASHIEELQADETEAYVMHRLQVVGWQGDPLIDRAIFPLIHKFSEGLPRRINLICSRLFLLGSVDQRHAIDVKDVRVVISELQAEHLAAGTGFAPDDFEVSGATEWVPVPAVATLERSDVHTRTINNNSFTDGDPAKGIVEQKKKEPSNINEGTFNVNEGTFNVNNAPQAASASDAFGLETSNARPEAQFANDQLGDNAPAGLTATFKSRAANSVSGERVSGPEEDKLGSTRPIWQRALAKLWPL